jgi:hypothetical protein
MTRVELVGGKLKVTKTAKDNGKPKKYPYPPNQYEALLKLAKGAGLDVESSKAAKTKAVNLVVKAALEDFIATQSKAKAEPKAEK